MRKIINQALTQKAQDFTSRVKFRSCCCYNRLKAIIASFNHPIKMVADIFDVDSSTNQIGKQTKEKWH